MFNMRSWSFCHVNRYEIHATKIKIEAMSSNVPVIILIFLGSNFISGILIGPLSLGDLPVIFSFFVLLFARFETLSNTSSIVESCSGMYSFSAIYKIC